MSDDHPGTSSYTVNLDSKINGILDAVKQHAPLYVVPIKEMLHKILYEGPLIIKPSSITCELFIEIFQFLNRNEVEKCQLLSRFWHQLIEKHSDHLPLYFQRFLRIQFTQEAVEHRLTFSCESYSNTPRILDYYSGLPEDQRVQNVDWTLVKNLDKMVFDVLDIRNVDGSKLSDDQSKFLIEMMEELVKMRGGRNVKLNNFRMFDEKMLYKLLDSALDVYKTTIRLDDWLLNLFNVSFHSKYVHIQVKNINVTDDILLHFSTTRLFDDPTKYEVQICPYSHYLSSFINLCAKWFEAYSNSVDPRKFIRKFTFQFCENHVNSEPNVQEFFWATQEFLEDYPRKLEWKNQEIFRYVYEVLKMDAYSLKVVIQYDLEFKENQVGNEAPCFENMGLNFLDKITFLVENHENGQDSMQSSIVSLEYL